MNVSMLCIKKVFKLLPLNIEQLERPALLMLSTIPSLDTDV